MTTDPPAPDLGVLTAARAIVNEYVLHSVSERESLAWTIARVIERHTNRDAQAARLAAVEQVVDIARAGLGWSPEPLDVVVARIRDAIVALDAGAVGAEKVQDG
jgi:hypothetical protein